jgi:hypothetical protein
MKELSHQRTKLTTGTDYSGFDDAFAEFERQMQMQSQREAEADLMALWRYQDPED